MGKPYAIGIDIGGQTAKLGIVNEKGDILKRSIIKSNTQLQAECFIDDLANEINRFFDINISIDKINGIGVGAPNGNYYNGCIENSANLTWCKNNVIPFSELLSKKIGLPVALTNDANAAAIGEMTYGAAKGMKNFIMITLGTGVGSGIVINGEVVYGHDGFAGELGHTCVIRENGRMCGCGKTGCLEAYASAIGVARTAIEILDSTNRKSLLRTIPPEKLTSKDVYDAAIKGDEVAKEIFAFTGKILGEKFADFVSFSSPEAIILFGGLTKAGNLLYNPIIEHMNLNLLPIWRGKIKVLFSTLKESDAAILGASALAWEI